MKKFKRTLALLLAFTLLASNVAYAQDGTDVGQNQDVEDMATTAEPETDSNGIKEPDIKTQTTDESVQSTKARSAIENEVQYFDVTFKVKNPISGEEVNIVDVQSIVAGNAAVIPTEVPQFEGYKFKEWRTAPSLDEGEKVEEATFDVINEDITVYALYESIGTYSVKINYMYSDGSMAAQAYEAEMKNGEQFKEEIVSPQIQGFTPSQTSVTVDTIENYETTVTYSGEAKQYTVKHMIESSSDETKYTEKESETLNGTVGLETQAVAKSYTGFTAGNVSNVTLAAAGTTVITIQYSRNSYEITYDSQGGSYVAPEIYKYGATITRPETPTRLGYEFTGWNDIPTTMPANDIKATASWRGNKTANYTVVYWQQRLDDPTKYDFVESKVKSGTVGNEAGYESKSYTGFELNGSKTNQKVTITGDGKAVKNVYFDRQIYHVYFYLYEDHFFWGEWVKQDNLTITAKYGENVQSQWTDAAHSRYMWYTNKDLRTSVGAMSDMEARDINRYGDTTGVNTIYYMTKNIDSNKYSQSTTGVLPNGWTINEGDIIQIDGFSYEKMDTRNRTLYYTRNNYKLSFANATGVSGATIPFEKSLSGYKPSDSKVGRPAGVDSDYTFGGWYTSPACEDGTEVNWSDKMPSHNLQIYAKWVAPQYQVSFDTNGATTGTPEAITVYKYNTIQEYMPSMPEKTDYEFAGWYTNEELTRPFIESRQITSDMILFAKWVKVNGSYDYTVACVDSNNHPIAELAYGKGEVNTNVNIVAPTINGYLPRVTSKNLYLGRDNQEVIFIYDKLNTWQYKVRYVDDKGNSIIPTEFETVETSKNIATVSYKPIAGYKLVSEYQQTVLRSTAIGVIPEVVFTYQPIAKATYIVKHLTSNQTGTKYKEVEDDRVTVTDAIVGRTVTASTKTYSGYKCITSGRALQGVVKADGSLVIEVKYKAIPYQITYTLDDGIVTGNPDTYTVLDHFTLKNPTKKGYTFEGWTGTGLTGAQKTVTVPVGATGDRAYTAVFTKNPTYRVSYYESKTQLFTGVTDSNEYENGQEATVYDGTGLTHDGSGKHVLVGWSTDPDIVPSGQNVINSMDVYNEVIKNSAYKAFNAKITMQDQDVKLYAVWANEAIFDVTLYYKTSDDKMGKVSPVSEPVNPKKGVAQGSKAIANDGYKFVNWTDKDNKVVSTSDTWVPTKKANEEWADGTTYTANFTKRTDLSYTVKYYYDNQEQQDLREVVKNQTFGASITTYTDKKPEGYMLEKKDGLPLTVGTGINEIKIYYAKDVIGTENPDQPDNVPDRYQVTFTYQAGEHGKVDGTLKEVITRLDGEGNPSETAVVSPKANVTATPNNGYQFVNFTSKGESFNSVKDIKAASFNGDRTFTANFSKRTDLSYTVKYYFDNQEQKELEEVVENQTFDTVVSTYTNKKPAGYMFEKEEGTPLTVGTDAKKNVIKVFYAKDVIGTEDPDQPDEVPDRYQVTFTYKSGDNGSVDGTLKEVVTKVDGEGKPSETAKAHPTAAVTATPNNGYKLQNFTSGTDSYQNVNEIREAGFAKDTEFVANFSKRTDLSYTVKYYFDNQEQSGLAYTTENQTYQDKITAVMVQNKKPVGYMLEKTENLPLTIGTDSAQNVVKVYYAKDIIGTEDPDQPDQVPDRFQVTFTYKSSSNGSVTGTKKEVVTKLDASNNPSETAVVYPKAAVKAEPNSGFKFVNWTSNSDSYNSVTEIQQAGFTTNREFTAHFTQRTDLSYIVKYYFDNQEQAGLTYEIENQKYGDVIEAYDNKKPEGYMLEKEEGLPLTIGDGENEIRVYYAKDVIGTENPDEPDGVPDRYQVTFTYVAGANGSISGTGKEVVTRFDASGKPSETATVRPNAAVTVDASNGYDFVNFTSGTNHYESADVIRNTDFTKDTEFKANFAKQTNLSYAVKYFFDNQEQPGLVEHVENQTFEDVIETYTDKKPVGYMLEKEEGIPLTIGTGENEIRVYYAKDVIGTENPDDPDEVPDRYQVTFSYVAGPNGKVSGIQKEVVTRFDADGQLSETAAVHPTANVTSTANNGYRFGNWVGGSASYENTEAIRTASFTSDQEFTAQFEIRTDLSYQVKYYFDNQLDSDLTENVENQTFEDVIQTYTDKRPEGYMLEKEEGLPLTVGTGANEIRVYYAKDVIGTEDPDQPDEIPDRYQVTFTYLASVNGSVEGTAKEVVTRYDSAGNPSETAAVYPVAAVTAKPDSGYHFNQWSDGNQSYASVDEMKAASFTKDTLFTADFLINSYELTINYLDTANKEMAQQHKEMVDYTDSYNVVSPVIKGYTADQKVISGTMQIDGVTINVIYTKNKHTVSIDYVTPEGETEVTDVNDELEFGDNYEYSTPEIPGYTASEESVQGKLEDEDVKVIITYAPKAYPLVINYVDGDGNSLAIPYTATINYKDAYSISSPIVTGYTAAQTFIAGNMPIGGRTVTVVYTANVTPETPTPVTPTPITPATPTPVAPTPATPATVTPVTPVTATIVQVPDEQVPLANIDVAKDELKEVPDEKVPLANMDLDQHKCCILHFLIMLLALIVELFYTRSMKKRQARIFELREQIELGKEPNSKA